MRYESLSANAAKLYCRTTQEVVTLLEIRGLDISALAVMSRDDSVIGPQGVLELSETRFANPKTGLSGTATIPVLRTRASFPSRREFLRSASAAFRT